ncbi:MAG: hypothetical protein GIKADHBN_00351 [Phycisphaerales bacterium]|nr:hypothetical protein [Phycisphaerales bacterium]
MISSSYKPGDRVRVTQQIARQSGSSAISVEGVVIRAGQAKTGSWYAHSKDDRLWLDRLELRKDDGELVTVNLDQYSNVDVLADAPVR